MQWTGEVNWPDGTRRALFWSNNLQDVFAQVDTVLPKECKLLPDAGYALIAPRDVAYWKIQLGSGWKIEFSREQTEHSEKRARIEPVVPREPIVIRISEKSNVEIGELDKRFVVSRARFEINGRKFYVHASRCFGEARIGTDIHFEAIWQGIQLLPKPNERVSVWLHLDDRQMKQYCESPRLVVSEVRRDVAVNGWHIVEVGPKSAYCQSIPVELPIRPVEEIEVGMAYLASLLAN